MTPGSTWMVNVIGSAGDGTTSRATSVPVFSLMSVAIATARRPSSGVVSVRVIVPVTAAAPCRDGRHGDATSATGPPVMTGTGSKLSRVVSPSTTDAYSA